MICTPNLMNTKLFIMVQVHVICNHQPDMLDVIKLSQLMIAVIVYEVNLEEVLEVTKYAAE